MIRYPSEKGSQIKFRMKLFLDYRINKKTRNQILIPGKKDSAASYSPTQLPVQYHRR